VFADSSQSLSQSVWNDELKTDSPGRAKAADNGSADLLSA
jgi:hypothetical protein